MVQFNLPQNSKILKGKLKTLSSSPIIDHNINLVEKVKKSRKYFN